MNNNRPLTIYTTTTRKASVFRETPTSVQDLITRLSVSQELYTPHEDYIKLSKAKQDELKDIGGYVAGGLKEGRRKAGCVQSRNAAVIDADNIPPEALNAALQAVEALGRCYVIHSTAKHSPSTPRLRIVIPFSEDIDPDKYEPTVRALCKLLQPEMTWFDPSTAEAGRLMYWPSHCRNVTPVYYWADRPFLYVDGLLAQFYPSGWQDVVNWPRFPREQAPTKRAAKQEDPTTKKGIIGAFCRAWPIPEAMEKFLPGVYEPTDQPDRYGNKIGGD